MKLQILSRSYTGKETEVMLIKDKIYNQTIYQVSICIARIEKPYYSNQLFKIFTDRKQAFEFYGNLCDMREQDEAVSTILKMGEHDE